MVGILSPGPLALLALATAAGVDLYLTLFVLSAAPLLGLWPALPGALADLASTGVLAVTGACYLAELAAERRFTSSIVWNALHAVIRPVSGGLLAFLVLDGAPATLLAAGTLAAALVTFAAHAVATGGLLLLRLERSDRLRPIFPSLLEDAAVLGLVALTLDRPAWGAAAAALLLAAILPVSGSLVRAFAFSVRLALGGIRAVLARDGWLPPAKFPGWLRGALARLGVGSAMAEGDELYSGLRAAPAAGLRLPGRPRLVTGWLVVHGDRPLFVYGREETAVLALDDLPPRWAADQGFLRVVELTPPPREGEGDPLLLLPRDAPSLRNLRAELGLPDEDERPGPPLETRREAAAAAAEPLHAPEGSGTAAEPGRPPGGQVEAHG